MYLVKQKCMQVVQQSIKHAMHCIHIMRPYTQDYIQCSGIWTCQGENVHEDSQVLSTEIFTENRQ